MAKRMLIMIIFLVIIFGGIAGWNIFKIKMMQKYFANFQPPPVTIAAIEAENGQWQPTVNSVGTIIAKENVDISTEIAGKVVSIFFESGAVVNKGDPIIQLDDSVEQAKLKDHEAQKILAEVNFKRQSELFQKNASSKANMDEAKAKLHQAEAAVDQIKAIIAQKRIISPFAGKLGIRKVNVGQFVSPGTSLVNLQAFDEVYIDFSIPEKILNQIKLEQPIEIYIDAYKGEVFKGHISAFHSQVDVQTQNILVRASLKNTDYKLYPGMFATIKVLMPVRENVIIIPESAVVYSLYGNSVFVVQSTTDEKTNTTTHTVSRRYVKVGERLNNRIVVEQGINAGDMVVTAGQLKLDEGVKVVIDNKINLH